MIMFGYGEVETLKVILPRPIDLHVSVSSARRRHHRARRCGGHNNYPKKTRVRAFSASYTRVDMYLGAIFCVISESNFQSEPVLFLVSQ